MCVRESKQSSSFEGGTVTGFAHETIKEGGESGLISHFGG